MVALASFWSGRSALVTGATGIVGSCLVKELVALDASVTALVRDADPQSEFYRSGIYREVSIVQGCLEDYRALERAITVHEVDTVFHLGAQPLVNVALRSPLQTFESNIRGTYNLLEACRVHGSLVHRVVIASSDKAYGTQDQLPYTEDMALIGRYPYDVSKNCADLISQSYFHTYGLPVAIARCGNIYGGGDLNWSRIVPSTLRACLRGAPVVIRSDGSFIRDYLYVRDVCTAYLALAENLDSATVKGQAFNFSPEIPVTVLDLVAVILRLMDCQHLVPEVRSTAQGEIRSQYLDASKALRLLNWRPRYSLEEGLTETIAWYRNFWESTRAQGAPSAADGERT